MAEHAALRLIDSTPLAKVLVRAAQHGSVACALGVAFGRAERDDTGCLVVGMLPGGWLLLAPPGSAAGVVHRMAAYGVGEFSTVIDVTHGHALVRLIGARAAAVLRKLCPIDQADAVIPDGAVFRSLLAGLTATVIRDDLAGERSYLLQCERSYGQYLVDVLLDAGAEFGIEGVRNVAQTR